MSAPAPAPAETLSPFQHSLRTCVRAGYPLLYVVSAEEERAVELIQAAAATGEETKRRTVYTWSVSRGLLGPDRKVVDRNTADPKRVLPFLLEFAQPGIFVLQDFHAFFDEHAPNAPLIIRQLRDLVEPFPTSRKTIVLLSPVLKLPPELEKDLTVLDLDLPDDGELLAVLEETIEQVKDNPKVEINLDGDARERIIQALTGLTRTEAENALAKVVVTNSRLDPDDVDLLLAEKEQIIRKSGTLEFYASPERFGSIGGLGQLKEWLRQRGNGFSEAARQFGLPNPRGLLLVGVPGCGKSLSAKAVAAEWKMPLLKFDLGKVFGGLVGQSEENMRRALKMAEAVAPCVLWIDEIEKGFSGVRGSSGDSGTSSRVFGTMLTWMEENKKPVFTIATANDIDGLPPELLRKGRFDEIFFIDLPSPRERANILAIHLAKHHRDFQEFDLAAHVNATDGYSGAELEQAVVSALYLAFAEGSKAQLRDEHLAEAIRTTVPLSHSMRDRVDRLRQAATQWRLASDPVEPQAPEAAAIVEPPAPVSKPRRIFET
jgi:SpoVK/Ycf46/Vps4 family AAA+-type ATPase